MRNVSIQCGILTLSMMSIWGCGGTTGPPMIPIRGEVTYNGKPLTQGRVVYMPQDPTVGRQASGPIQPDGTFVLTTQTAGDGAMFGQYGIVVFSRGNAVGNATSREEFEAAAKQSGGSAIPEKYMNDQTSGLSDTVDAEHSGFKKIELN